MNLSAAQAKGSATHNTQAIALLLCPSCLSSGDQDPKVLFPQKNRSGWGFVPIYLNPQSSAHQHLQHNMIIKKFTI